jgi:hypothetical protein
LTEEYNGKDYFEDQDDDDDDDNNSNDNGGDGHSSNSSSSSRNDDDDDDDDDDDIVLDGICCRKPDQYPIMGFCKNGHEPLGFIPIGII